MLFKTNSIYLPGRILLSAVTNKINLGLSGGANLGPSSYITICRIPCPDVSYAGFGRFRMCRRGRGLTCRQRLEGQISAPSRILWPCFRRSQGTGTYIPDRSDTCTSHRNRRPGFLPGFDPRFRRWNTLYIFIGCEICETYTTPSYVSCTNSDFMVGFSTPLPIIRAHFSHFIYLAAVKTNEIIRIKTDLKII